MKLITRNRKPAWCRVPVLTGLLTCCLFIQGAEAGQALSGEYEIVAIRKSNLAMAGPDDPSLSSISPGDSIRFAETLQWLGGQTCDEWSVEASTSVDIDPSSEMLSDVQVTAARLDASLPDHRVNRHWVLYCDLTARAPILEVDDRVLVTMSPSMQSYLLLEKTVNAEDIEAVQKALVSMKFHGGEVSGVMDDATRRSLALFAGYLGAGYDFNASPISGNLLEALGLGVDAPAPAPAGWTDRQITSEMARLRFLDDIMGGEGRYRVVSGFFEGDAAAATPELDRIGSFLAGLPSLEHSVLAGKLKLLPVEWQEDSGCPTSDGCYRSGFVVGLGPLEPPQAANACRLFRANGWFCATP